MEVARQLEDQCLLIDSNKITSRRQGCDGLIDLLSTKSTIDFLNSKGQEWWNKILQFILSSMTKDAVKKAEEVKKKGQVASFAAPKTADLFVTYMKVAVKETAPLNYKKLLNFITNALNDTTMKCFEHTFINTISHSFLTNANVRGQLKSENWESLYLLLKSLCGTQTALYTEQIKCISLIIKWGPFCNFPVAVYRQEFAFVIKLCQEVSSLSPIPQQEAVLRLVIDFCKHAAKDNRMACCKLGEEVFTNLMELYRHNSNNNKMKTDLVEFLLLQVAVHHPGGVKQHHPAAYAVSWPKWKQCLCSIYEMLTNEIDISLGLSIRNQSFFVLKNDIKRLCDSFVCLFVEVCRQLFGNSYCDFQSTSADPDDRPLKRRKTDFCISNLIEKIKCSKSWTWLNLVYPLIERYTDVIDEENYFDLLRTLSTLQVESKECTLLHHIYNALCVLDTKLERNIEIVSHRSDFEQLWKAVADTSLRSMTLSQNDTEIQVLIRQLIVKGVIKTQDALLQNYCPEGVLNITVNNLRTLDLVFQSYTYLQYDNNLKIKITRWILKNNSKCFCNCYVAEILVNLVLKQWPSRVQETEVPAGKPFQDIEEIYLSTSFESLLIYSGDIATCHNTNIFCCDHGLLGELTQLLQDVGNDEINQDIDNLLNVTILIFNVTSYLVKYGILPEDSTLPELCRNCVKTLFDQLHLQLDKQDARKLEKTICHLTTLNVWFSTNINGVMSQNLREIVPENVIRSMFLGLNEEIEDGAQETQLLTYKKRVIETLTSFCCLPDPRNLHEIQNRALEALLASDYDYSNDKEYDVVIVLLKAIISCKIDFLAEDNLISVFNLFQGVCEARYNCYKSAVTILSLFYDIYPLVSSSKSELCQSQFAKILSLFYSHRLDYGPDVSIKLLHCMGLLFELEPECVHSRWSNEEIVLNLPEFLTSDYHDVRITAIKTIMKFYVLSSRSRLLTQFHRQELMFTRISEKSLLVLQIEGKVSDDRMVDETVTRTSTILHTYASIMMCSYLWVEESLFTLLKIASDKNLDPDQMKIILELAAKNLGFENAQNFVETYLFALFNRWKCYNIDQFPFVVFKCTSKTEFYQKYWNVLSPFFIEADNDILNVVARNSNRPLEELLEVVYAKLLSYCIVQEAADLRAVKTNRIYKYLCETISVSKMKTLFETKIEEIFLHLIEFVNDDVHFKKNFEEPIIFAKIVDLNLTVEQFEGCVKFMESAMCKETSLMFHLMNKNEEKIHFILLQLLSKIEAAKALEEKLKYFHLYSVVCMMCIESIKNDTTIRKYLVRQLIHTLLHFIKDYKTHLELSRVSCKFLKTVLQQLVPKLADTVEEFLLIIFSRLKYIALENCPLSALCVDMLQFLIVDNKSLFIHEIQKLDSIPQTPEFQQIYSVHYRIKYSDRVVTLEDEIRQFLIFGKNTESFEECEDSLDHLRNVLASRKDELNDLYNCSRTTRGFSEACANSSLHQLICMLITFTCSINNKVSSQAVRCLGEIGPADLGTLILQAEKPIADPSWTPWELTLGYTLSLLSKYIVDFNVKVMKAASESLFRVLSTKEGRRIAELEEDFGFGRINCMYLRPFCASVPHKSNFSTNVNDDFFINTISEDDLWIPQHSSHENWITRLVCSILESFHEKHFFSSLIEVCKLKVEFCGQLLPLVIYTILNANGFKHVKRIVMQIRNFFDKHWEITVKKDDSSRSITTNKLSVQCMLNVVHFVRLQSAARQKQIKGMNLDYLKIAKAAHYCTAHFTALLYAELWCQQQIDLAPDEYNHSSCTFTNLDLIYEKEDEITGSALYNILREAYKAIGEVDALLGCGTSHLLDRRNQVEHHKELGRWEEVSFWYDLEVSLSQKSPVQPLMESLINSNLYQLPLLCSNALEQPQYECLWRLGEWNYNCRRDNESDNSCDKYKFFALKALHDSDEFNFNKALDGVRASIIENLVGVDFESSKNFYGILTQMQCFKEMEDFAEAVQNNAMSELLVKWKAHGEVLKNDFHFVEPINAQRTVLFKEFLAQPCQNEDLRNLIIDTMLEFSRYSRMEGKDKVASRILGTLRLLPSLSNDVHAKIKLEEAELCWTIPDVLLAKCILRDLCTSENVNPRLHATALKMTGKWMVESSSESRETIIETYLKKSLQLLQKIPNKTVEDQNSILDTYDQLAKFADREYQQVMTHIKSDVFQKKKENMVKTQQAINNINISTASKDLRKAVAIKQKQNCIDQAEVDNTESEKNDLLQLALRYYLLNLSTSDDHNITIYRLISLLLENRNNEVVRSVLETELIKIPSYKYITILPQVIPHISTAPNDFFGQAIYRVIEKCARDHPYHTLPLILSLALSNKDREYAEAKAVVNDQRMQTATSLLKKLKTNAEMNTLIQKMVFLSEAIIELAYYKTDGGEAKNLKIPKRFKIKKIQEYSDVLLPTYNLSVDKSTNYKKIVGISSFGDTYNNVGGINAPKQVTCRGTDGFIRTQLIKGQDDLRQDAVMQQVFTIMNSLLAVDKQTRHLLIRTYKIVPLSMRSGILEWVDNSMPIGEYLTGKDGEGGAHAQYRPMDKLPKRCRVDFKNLNNKLLSEKIRLFKNICNNIKPVFHKFFEDTFPQPTVWYERRRAYTHSVATSSMCGYILGIGDRHVSNILIDKNTAEVIHIDFGIAFEQGRVLPTAETVPFRLTRDIVDGMGVSGVEGVFRKSCEKTMEVLRTHHQTIITILEVLLYDPLYDWTVSSAEANKRQKDEQDTEVQNLKVENGSDEEVSQDVNVTAERALLRLKAKLQGTEFGYGKLTTVERQVGTLIQQAVDPSNMCRLFHGWQPYL